LAIIAVFLSWKKPRSPGICARKSLHWQKDWRRNWRKLPKNPAKNLENKKGSPIGLPFGFIFNNRSLFLFAAGSLFGSFEGVDLLVGGDNFHFFMGGDVAQTLCPLPRGGRAGRTDLANGAVDDAFATLTFLNDGLAGIAFEDAAVFGPEGTLGTGLDSFTFHGIQMPPLCRFPKENFGLKDAHYLTAW
jgi:hypothetical protein